MTLFWLNPLIQSVRSHGGNIIGCISEYWQIKDDAFVVLYHCSHAGRGVHVNHSASNQAACGDWPVRRDSHLPHPPPKASLHALGRGHRS